MTFTYGGAWKRPIPRSGTEVTMGQRWGGQRAELQSLGRWKSSGNETGDGFTTSSINATLKWLK